MLSLIGCTACTQVEDTSLDSSVPVDSGDTADTADTGQLPPEPVMFDQNQPGPYTEVCNQEAMLEAGLDPDLLGQWLEGGSWAVFNHAAQVLTAKFQAVLPSGSAPSLTQVCIELGYELTTGNPGPVPIIGDCPDLIPDTHADVLNAIPQTPYNLQQYYQYEDPSTPDAVIGVEFTNIAYEHPNHPLNFPLPEAMNGVEALHGNPPGCWIKFDLVNDAAAGDTKLNSMPIVLFTNHAYLTAAVLEADHPEGSLVVSGATFTVPGEVASFLAGGPVASPAPVPYAELYLSAGYPPDASTTINMDQVDFSILDVASFDAPFDQMPHLLGSGIVDPVTEEDLRELDWALTEHVEQVNWDTDPSTLDLSYDPAFDTAARGSGMPPLWPAQPDKR